MDNTVQGEIQFSKLNSSEENKKMTDEDKTKQQLINELAELRQGVLKLERSEAERKQAEQEVQEASSYAESIIETVREPLIVLDAHLRVKTANRAFYKVFKVSPENAKGKFIYDFGNHQWDNPKLRKLLEEIIPMNNLFQDFEIDHEFPIIGRRIMLLNARRIYREDIGTQAILLAIEDITERKRAEEEIGKERDKAQKYLDIAEVMIVAIDVDQKITLVNKKCCEVLGCGEQEIIGKNWFDTFIPERVKDEVKAVFEKLMAGKIESVESFENPVLTRRGEERLIAWHNTILKDEEGNIAGTLSSGEDITERKRAEKRLSLLASIVDSSDDAIIGKTLDGIIVSWNRGAQKIYGYSADEVRGKSISILVPPGRPNEFPQLLERIRQGQRIEHHETIRIRKDGKKICASLTISPIKDATGKIIGASTIAWDITEQKRIEIALRESEARFRSITQSAADAIISADSDDNIISWNRGAQIIFGYTEEEALGKSLTIIIPERYRDAHKKGLERVNSTGETRIIGKTVEMVGMRKDGSEFPLELSLSTWKIGIRRLYSGIIRDVTERKQADEKLKQTLAELERSNKDLEQFAYAASHDLQEPLRTVSNFSQLLARRYKGELDAKADQFIGFIVDGATRMQQMIDDLLAYSRVSTRAKPFEPTDCETVFDQALTNVKMAVEESGAIVTHDPLPTVMADASQMVQLFQNLISNAIKFRKEKPRITVSAVQKEKEWLFSVQDNGIGIAPEFMEYIFKMFQREHASTEYPGTGVGLVICKKIVERHGGRIWVESQVGKGSTFYFTIPVRKGERERT